MSAPSPYRTIEKPPLSVVVTTGEELPGHRVTQILGVVHGFGAAMLPHTPREAVREALGGLIEEARQLRAEAVVGLRYESSEHHVIAYGTAVRLVRVA